jgi:hypothetical protein
MVAVKVSGSYTAAYPAPDTLGLADPDSVVSIAAADVVFEW